MKYSKKTIREASLISVQRKDWAKPLDNQGDSLKKNSGVK